MTSHKPGTLEAATRAAYEAVIVHDAASGSPVSPPWDNLTEKSRDTFFGLAAHALARGWFESVYEASMFEVPYSELPEAQRRKDRLFRDVVLAMAEALR